MPANPADHQYEVISKYRVQSVNNADKAPLFLCELDYGGIFHVEACRTIRCTRS